LQTIINYDRIFVLEKGKLIQKGTPKELMQNKGLFRNMIKT